MDKVPLFKAAEGERPLLLLPGRPPQPLALDQPLAATGAVREGQKQVRRESVGFGGVVVGGGSWKACLRLDSHLACCWLARGGLHADTCATEPLSPSSINLTLSSHPSHPQVKLAVAFQDVELLRSSAAEAVPEDDNPALLR